MIVHLLSPSGSGSITLCGEHDKADADMRLTTRIDRVTCRTCQQQWAAFVGARGKPNQTRSQDDEQRS